MTVEDMLADCAWFTQWVTPAGKTKFACRPLNGTLADQFVGDTPREALEKMTAAVLPNPELF